MKVSAFNPTSDIPDLAGKVILVTGGTGGLGKESVLALAKHHPRHITFTGRNAAKAEEVISLAQTNSSTTVSFIPCDLASLTSVKAAADTFLAKSYGRLDVLMCNAGIIDAAPAVSEDGYEITFATNHLGHALLIRLLLPVLQKTPGCGRIVSLTSTAFRSAPKAGIAFEKLNTPMSSGFAAALINYCQSKLANILYVQELARRYPEVTSIVVHPGSATTPMVKEMNWGTWLLIRITSPDIFLSPERGAYSQLWAATVPRDAFSNGGYYEPVGEKGKETKHMKDAELAKKLFDYTEQELQPYLRPKREDTDLQIA
ncbi:MAG: hypothetical protein CYPHOPRED_003209 [Cyphobasidiales sp. Tagirdzhanova-0007]|nr:MAG: hypothetical protein CYPHOPRED_003209 [Cyphobasidiales sp. Tagirdzhanova-0007]